MALALTLMPKPAATTALPSSFTRPETTGPLHGRPLLEIHDVHHQWRKAPSPVLDGVSLTLVSGEATWIGGRNGVGKTTLLRVAGGILAAQRGTVSIEGCTPRSRGGVYQRRLGYLSAGDRGLYARVRVTQQLDYWARLAFVARSERQGLVAAAIADFGLDHYAHHRVDRLSQGWRQRVRLAMAFLHRPDVLLLDEPRNSLDDDGYAVLNSQVQAAAARGATVLWCSPRGEDRAIEFDRSFTLENGHLVATA
ncbi:MAG: ABC transporter ATP-binding protein [Solirubrobacteraceae bacterium]